MKCSNCGNENINGEKFCKNCGVLLEDIDSQSTLDNQQTNINDINEVINPNMKKWAILSIVTAVVGMLWYCFIGLTVYLSIFIPTLGIVFSELGKKASKKLSIIGKILNIIFLCVSFITFFMILSST